MSFNIIAKTFAIWFVILVAAAANGALREFALIPFFGKTSGLVLSGLLLSALILVITYLSLPWIGRHTSSTYIAVGMSWLVLTLIFEFSFGLLRGKPLSEILAAYTFKDGNLWSAVLLITALAPWLAASLKGWR